MPPLTSASGDPAPPLVRLRRRAELAAAAPYLLGFHPAESLIAVAMRRPRGRLGLLVRTDLPPPGEESSRAAAVARYIGTDNADAALLIVYTDEADQPADNPVDGRVRRHLVEQLRHALDELGVSLYEALLVRGGRWSSYLCRDPVCCPVEGSPVDAHVEDLAAASALSGDVILDSRADLARSIEPVGGPAAAAVGAAVDKALNRMSPRRGNGGPSRPGRPEGWDLVHAELDARRAVWRGPTARAGPQLRLDRLAELVVALTDPQIRDAALARCVGDHAEALEPLWVELVRRVPAPLDAAPATLLAVTAYARGNGAFAGVCLERALSSHPGYPLAELVLAALQRAVPPRLIVAAIRSEEVGMRGP